MENNPYSAPESDINPESSPSKLHAPRRVPLSNGFAWIKRGFDLFIKDPGNWIIICVVGFAILLMLSLFSKAIMHLSMLTTAIWFGGIMIGCKSLEEGKGIAISHLFMGFTFRPVPLFLISLVVYLLSVAAGVLSIVIVVEVYEVTLDLYNIALMLDPQYTLPMLMAFLIYTALTLPVIALAWFAPALVAINDVPLLTALGMSIKACFLNFFPFVVYGLVLTVLFIVALLPIGLGLLVLVPIFYASLYISYKDIFIDIE